MYHKCSSQILYWIPFIVHVEMVEKLRFYIHCCLIYITAVFALIKYGLILLIYYRKWWIIRVQHLSLDVYKNYITHIDEQDNGHATHSYNTVIFNCDIYLICFGVCSFVHLFVCELL